MRMRLFHARYTSGAVVVTTSTTSAGRKSASAKRRSCCAVDPCPRRDDTSASALQDLLDARLRLVERFLGFLLTDKRRLDRGRHRVADRGPLGHARPPVDVGILLERGERGFDEVGSRVLHGIEE